jgi:decaprenylphospho-beta-D-erythro-pentofuranosid-2-ulose 2-reductase
LSYLVLGASGGLGRALCYRFAAARQELVIVSSDSRDLAAMKSDLELRYGARVIAAAVDVAREPDYLEKLRSAAASASPLRGLLFPIGAVQASDDGELDPASAERLVRVNFLSVVDTVALFLPSLRERAGSTIVGFGSIAGARGRGANAVYSASKRALESYFESLRHACADRGPLVQFYVVGYLDTSQSAGRTKLFPKASPEHLANRVERDRNRDIGRAFYPRYWRSVCLALRFSPWFLYKRMRF